LPVHTARRAKSIAHACVAGQPDTTVVHVNALGARGLTARRNTHVALHHVNPGAICGVHLRGVGDRRISGITRVYRCAVGIGHIRGLRICGVELWRIKIRHIADHSHVARWHVAINGVRRIWVIHRRVLNVPTRVRARAVSAHVARSAMNADNRDGCYAKPS
jgi:hypothetical protein